MGKKILFSANVLLTCTLTLLSIIATPALLSNRLQRNQSTQKPTAVSTLAPLPIPTGHYKVITRFLAGPKAGQIEEGTYDIRSDGSLTVFFLGVGTGYGTISLDADKHQYILTFREVLPGMGDIQVVQIASTLSHNQFVSQGYGELYVNGHPQQESRSMTISTATLM
ncbi:MAG TPA: hypothetical protein VFV38_31615 [Ktedonobacteraceae bacterium]|nr:hypothetical protein [Ktedonobacteraceae bacterium]